MDPGISTGVSGPPPITTRNGQDSFRNIAGNGGAARLGDTYNYRGMAFANPGQRLIHA